MKFQELNEVIEHFQNYNVVKANFDVDAVREYFLAYGKRIEDDELSYTGFNFFSDQSQCEKVFHENWGDGNDLITVFKFSDPNNPENFIYLMFEGWYSSWDSSKYLIVSLVQPYEHTETRYKIM
jgi:hypothetical protein